MTIENEINGLITGQNNRRLRHLILLLFLAMITMGMAWDLYDEGYTSSTLSAIMSAICIFIFFVGESYLNLYLLIPRLLFQNKWGQYFFCLLGLALLFMCFVIVFQLSFQHNSTVVIKEISLFKIIINIFSSTISISLVFVSITSFVVFKRYLLDSQESRELESTTLQLELQLLENQINPHFLFNMLNNANILIKKDADKAKYILKKLEAMLRYLTNSNSQEAVLLTSEIGFLNDYLELETIRRDDFEYSVDTSIYSESVKIPPQLFIVFVENAVKHNQDPKTRSYVHISFVVSEDQLIFECKNSIPSIPTTKTAGGIGLVNIRRRLELLYSNKYSLENNKTKFQYHVRLVIDL